MEEPTMQELENELTQAKMQLATASCTAEDLKRQLKQSQKEIERLKHAKPDSKPLGGPAASRWFGRRRNKPTSVDTSVPPASLHSLGDGSFPDSAVARSDGDMGGSSHVEGSATSGRNLYAPKRQARVFRDALFKAGMRCHTRTPGQGLTKSPWHPLRSPQLLSRIWACLGPEEWTMLRLVNTEWAHLMVRPDLTLWREAARQGVIDGRWHSRMWSLVLLGGLSEPLASSTTPHEFQAIAPLTLRTRGGLRHPQSWACAAKSIRPPTPAARLWVRPGSPPPDKLMDLAVTGRKMLPGASGAPHQRSAEATATAMQSTLPPGLPAWYIDTLRAVAACERAAPAVADWKHASASLDSIRREHRRMLEQMHSKPVAPGVSRAGASVSTGKAPTGSTSSSFRSRSAGKPAATSSTPKPTSPAVVERWEDRLRKLSMRENDMYLKLNLLRREAEAPVIKAHTALAHAARSVASAAVSQLPSSVTLQSSSLRHDRGRSDAIELWVRQEGCIILPIGPYSAPVRTRAVARLARRASSSARAGATSSTGSDSADADEAEAAVREALQLGASLPWEPPVGQIDADIARTFGAAGSAVRTSSKRPEAATSPRPGTGGDATAPISDPPPTAADTAAACASSSSTVTTAPISTSDADIAPRALTPKERALARLNRKLAAAGRQPIAHSGHVEPSALPAVPVPVVGSAVPSSLSLDSGVDNESSSDAEAAAVLGAFPGDPGTSVWAARLSLRRILLVTTCLDRATGYTQGLNFVAWTALRQLGDEAAATAVVCSLLHRPKYGLRHVFRSGLSRVMVFFYSLERLLERCMAPLAAHLRECGITPDMYASGWAMTIFSNGQSLPDTHVLAAWTVFILDGWPGLLRVSLALLDCLRPHLMNSDFGEAVQMLNSVPEAILPSPSSLMKRSFEFSVTEADVEMLSKRYLAAHPLQFAAGKANQHTPEHVSAPLGLPIKASSASSAAEDGKDADEAVAARSALASMGPGSTAQAPPRVAGPAQANWLAFRRGIWHDGRGCKVGIRLRGESDSDTTDMGEGTDDEDDADSTTVGEAGSGRASRLSSAAERDLVSPAEVAADGTTVDATPAVRSPPQLTSSSPVSRDQPGISADDVETAARAAMAARAVMDASHSQGLSVRDAAVRAKVAPLSAAGTGSRQRGSRNSPASTGGFTASAASSSASSSSSSSASVSVAAAGASATVTAGNGNGSGSSGKRFGHFGRVFRMNQSKAPTPTSSSPNIDDAAHNEPGTPTDTEDASPKPQTGAELDSQVASSEESSSSALPAGDDTTSPVVAAETADASASTLTAEAGTEDGERESGAGLGRRARALLSRLGRR